MTALFKATAIEEQLAQARKLLSAATTVDRALNALDYAETLEAALKVLRRHQDDAGAAHADAWELMQRARRRTGELTSTLAKSAGGRPARVAEKTPPRGGEVSKGAMLKELGVSSQQASRMEKLAALPPEDFAARIERKRAELLEKSDAGLASVTAEPGFDKDAWQTWDRVLDAERRVLGSLGLDPASNDTAQKRVKASKYYTRESNGLTQPWKTDGGLHLNPPFSPKLVAQFALRWDELAGVDFAQGILIVNATTDTSWFQKLMAKHLVCLTKRLPFHHPVTGELVNQNRVGQGIFYFGPKPKAFAENFRQFGEVMMRYAR